MIYTVTFNPALDYVVKVNHFMQGVVNRTVEEGIYYGGKGINVSAVLATLGFPSTAFGFVAGFTGEEIQRRVKALGFQSDFIKVEKGMSRINVKLKSDVESEINGMGPEIGEEEVNKFFDKLQQLREGDVLVLSGSIPHSMGDDIYQRIMERLEGRGVLTVVDATRDLVLPVLGHGPFLIKPNKHELGEMFGKELQGDGEVIGHALRLQEKGARNVLVSMAGEGAILVTQEGQVHKMLVPKGTVKNSVGAGDSMVAGFIAGYLEGGDWLHALRLGSAAGSASAFSDGLGSKEDIMKYYGQLS